ncbi:MAG: branched-chain amino acid ABC transporter permease [Firmicutes bacterium]|nr:branched-chain amino acid ABC transporter permease [Bacillota bacterium]
MTREPATWRIWLHRGIIGLLVLGLIAVNVGVYTWYIDYYLIGILTLVGINIILAASLNLINGYTGQFSIGHAGFMAVGAYGSALISINLGWPFVVTLFSAALMAGLLGVVIGLPTLRLRGDYLAIATLGFGEIIRVLILNLPFTGGPRGLPGIPPKTTFFWVEAVAILTLIVISNIKNSSHGRALFSIREDEIASEAMGVDTTKYKVLAFAIGAAFAGVAGALFAHFQMFIDPKSFAFMKSIEILTMVVLGGMGSLTGSVLAATTLTILPEALRGFSEYRMIVYSAILVTLMPLRPQGLLGHLELTDLLPVRRRKTHSPVAPVQSEVSGRGSGRGGEFQ